MLKIAICDDSRADVEQAEAALDTLSRYPVSYDVYFSAGELLRYTSLNRESYHLYILDISRTSGRNQNKIEPNLC